MPDFLPGTEVELKEATLVQVPSGIRDLRGLLWSSIDNPESRDLDQIEFAAREGNSIRLYIGVANVTMYVRRGGVIDRRAAQNTVSIYTAGKTFHLLPEPLSTDRTSLHQDVDRCAAVIEMLIEPDGQVRDASIYPALVRNRARLSYDTVARVCEGDAQDESICAKAGLREQLDLQLAAADRLDKLRKELGALTFSSYEARPVTKDGQLVDLTLVNRTRARDMIESFMIASNVAAATFLKERGWPIIERVVRAPRHWDRIRQIAAGFGESLPESPEPKPLSEFLDKRRAADFRSYRDLSLTIVKLLGSGEYVVETPGGLQSSHFGLAVDDYSHTTAPNRRYADQVLQRMLLACATGSMNPFSDAELREVARHCTEREDAARKVERTMRKVAAAFLLRNRVGEVFPAIVTGASAKGTYVRLKSPPAEGKIIRGFRGVLVGDRVHVRLLAVDPERGFIDFERT